MSCGSQIPSRLSNWGALLLLHQTMSGLLANSLGLFPLLGILRLAEAGAGFGGKLEKLVPIANTTPGVFLVKMGEGFTLW